VPNMRFGPSVRKAAGCLYPLGVIVLATVSAILGFWVIPWNYNWPRWTGAALGMGLVYVSVSLWNRLSVAIGMKRLDEIACSAVWEESEKQIRQLVESGERSRKVRPFDQAERVLARARRLYPNSDPHDHLGQLIENARERSLPME